MEYSSEYQEETGKIKLSFPRSEGISIRNVKFAIQDAIQAPVCDQRLFYQDRLLTDDSVLLSRLYFREGDHFKLNFLSSVDISGMKSELNALKGAAKEIVDVLERQLPNDSRIENDFTGLLRFFYRLQVALEKLAAVFFHPWKCVKTVAHRHFFVQEGGFDALLEVFKFSRELFMNKDEIEEEDVLEQRKYNFNRVQLGLQQCCLDLLWVFSERAQDREFVLSKSVLPMLINALLLPHSYPVESFPTLHDGRLATLVLQVNEAAIGCVGGLVELDPDAQEVVSKMSQLIDKLVFMIDRRQSLHAGYSLFSSQVAANTLFYCTFNAKSAKSLVDCGALEKIIDITTNLLDEMHGDTPLRYYCCLFLARILSASTVRVDKDTRSIVDELINKFLERHIPSEISEWEESLSFEWVTMVPLVHLAFGIGKDWRKTTDQIIQENFNGQSHLDSHSSTNMATLDTSKIVGDSDTNLDVIISPLSGIRGSEMVCLSNQFTLPGSSATQKLGIFSLVHMLSIKDNQKLAVSQNLVPYLVCLSWQLNPEERGKLIASLANFHNISPPSLKIAAKSVLSLVNGFDTVFNL